MTHGKFIYILGDLHGDFTVVNRFIEKEIRLNRCLAAIAPWWTREGRRLDVVILQCGDFAFFGLAGKMGAA